MNPHSQVEPLTQDEVLAAARDLVTAFGRTDTAAYFAAFAPEATFVFHTEPHRLEERAEYEALWKSWLAEDWSVLSCESTGARVQLCGTSAVFSHNVRTTVRAGEDVTTTYERETIIFARAGDRILAVHEHLSPAADPAVRGEA